MLGGVGLFLRLVDRARIVLGWRVDRDQPERHRARVDEVVSSAAPDEDQVIRADRAPLAVEASSNPIGASKPKG